MITLFPKKIVLASIFLGIALFFGGVSTASAYDFNVDTSGDAVYEQLDCGFIGYSKITDCFPIVVYYLLYKPVTWVLVGSGYIFDKMLSLSTDSSFISQPFINSTWTVVRDFANMLFIFILIFAGIQTTLSLGNWKQTIKMVIIVALLINFSLFFTKVVIDAGNILAVGVLSSINPGGSISEGLVGSFQPQQFLGTAGEVDALNATVVFLIATVVSGFAAYIFFKAALLFMGRLIAFWGLMIISPFAFISMAMPMGNIFNKWLDTLLSQAFVAPVFLFFVYLIMKVISAGSTGILGGFAQSGGWFESLIGPVIVATLLIMALQKALGIASDMAGDFGKMGSDMVSAAMGVTSIGMRVGTAVATGGASLAVGGFKGVRIPFTEKRIGAFKGLGSEGRVMGTVNKLSSEGGAGKWLRKQSFDVRNVGGDDSMFGHVVGGVIKQGVGTLGIGKGVGEGGVAASRAKQDKIDEDKMLKAAASAQLTQAEVAAIHKREARNEAERMDKARDAQEAAKNEASEAKKEHDESETAAIVKSIQKGFEEASKAKDVEGAKKLAESLKVAKEAHASSATGIRLEKAVKGLEVATKEVAKAQEHTATIIKEEKERRANIHARKAEARGRYDTVAKILKGEKGGKKSVSDTLKDLLKEAGEVAETKPADEAKH